MNKTDWTSEVRASLDSIRRQLQASLYYAESDVLQQRPAPGKWNALECLEHLTLVNETYIRNIEKTLEKTRPSSKTRFAPGFLGGYLIKANRPGAGGSILMPTRTLKPYIPQPDRRAQAVFQDFDRSLDALSALLERAKDYDLHTPVLTLMPPLRIRLGAAFLVLTAHIERHLLQAERAVRG
ncbi:hypothetical protein GC167_06835 [bacterium]|nr:hypothetical protein [bacterium]